jgi:hypothetical protein
MRKFDFSMKNLKWNSPEAATLIGLTAIVAFFLFEKGYLIGGWLHKLMN